MEFETNETEQHEKHHWGEGKEDLEVAKGLIDRFAVERVVEDGLANEGQNKSGETRRGNKQSLDVHLLARSEFLLDF